MKPFFYIFVFAALIALFGLFIGLTVGAFGLLPLSPFVIPGHSMVGYLVTFSGFLTLAIPIFSLFHLVTRQVRPYRLSSHFKKGMRLVWVASLFVSIYGFVNTITDFRANSKQFSFSEFDIEADTIHFNVTDPAGYYHGWYEFADMRYTGNAIYDDEYNVRVKKSTNEKLRIERTVWSQGNDVDKAAKYARSLEHNIKVSENELNIPSRYKISKGDKYRGQHVEYVIYIPEGKEIVFDRRSWGSRFSLDFNKDYSYPRDYHKYSWTIGEKGLTSKTWSEISNFKRNEKIDGVQKINVKSNFEIDIVHGEENEVVIVGNKKEVEKISIIRQEDMLTIINEEGRLHYPIKVHINTTGFNTLATSTDKKVRIEGFKQDEMNILLNGDGDLNAYIDIGNLYIHAEEYPDISLTGKGKALKLDVKRHSDLYAEDYEVEELELVNYVEQGKIKVTKLVKTKRSPQRRFKIVGDPEIQLVDEQGQVVVKNQQ